jgi:hypothetical protein
MSPTPVAEPSILERRQALPEAQWLQHLRETFEAICQHLDQGRLVAEIQEEHREGRLVALLDRGEWAALIAAATASPRKPVRLRGGPSPPRRVKNEPRSTGPDRA